MQISANIHAFIPKIRTVILIELNFRKFDAIFHISHVLHVRGEIQKYESCFATLNASIFTQTLLRFVRAPPMKWAAKFVCSVPNKEEICIWFATLAAIKHISSPCRWAFHACVCLCMPWRVSDSVCVYSVLTRKRRIQKNSKLQYIFYRHLQA